MKGCSVLGMITASCSDCPCGCHQRSHEAAEKWAYPGKPLVQVHGTFPMPCKLASCILRSCSNAAQLAWYGTDSLLKTLAAIATPAKPRLPKDGRV